MFAIGLPVYVTWRHGLCKFPITTCFFTCICEVFERFLKHKDKQPHVVIGLIYGYRSFFFFFLFENQAGCWVTVVTLLI